MTVLFFKLKTMYSVCLYIAIQPVYVHVSRLSVIAGLDHWTGLLDWTTGLTFQPILAQSRSFSQADVICLFARLVAQRLHGYTALVIWSPAAPLALQIAIEVYIIIITACAEPSGDTVVPIFTMSTSCLLAILVLSPLLFMPSSFAFSVCNHWTGLMD